MTRLASPVCADGMGDGILVYGVRSSTRMRMCKQNTYLICVTPALLPLDPDRYMGKREESEMARGREGR